VQLSEKKEIININQLQKEVGELELKLAAISNKIRRSLDDPGDFHITPQ